MLNTTGNINDFPGNKYDSVSFEFKEKITCHTDNNCPKDVEIMIPLKYPGNFWRTLEMSLINLIIL